MKRHSTAAVRLATVGVAALAWQGAVVAQETPPAPVGLGEDIIVTAQRRSESVQTVPIAISAFSSAELDTRGIRSTLDLIQYVPNLFGSNNTGLGSANAYYIRGLGNTETIATFDPPVGTYIDDVYLSRQNANNFSFFDVERIEVLRGPQGTLYGRNTTGGAINVILKRPGDVIAGYVEAGYGSYNKKTTRASIDLPFTPALAIKISGYYQDDDGYGKNTTTGQRFNDDDGAGIRGAFRWNVTDRLSWNGAVAYMRSDGENILNFDCDPRNPANCDGRFGTTGLLTNYNTIATTSPFIALGVTGRKAGFGGQNKVDSVLYTSNIEWKGDNHTLNLITGVVDTRQKYALDFADGRGLPNVANPNPTVTGYTLGGFTLLNDGKHRQFTQEVKLNGTVFGGFLDYVTGAYFYDEDNTTDFADVFTLGLAPPPRGFPLLLADRTLRNSTAATAGYFQADANITSALKLTAGVRYTDEKKTFRVNDNRPRCLVIPLPTNCLDNSNLIVNLASGPVAIPTEQRTKIWTPRFVVNYQLTDVLLFASATRGFKSGGWNARGTAPNTLLPFDPEKVWSYEGGVRSQFFANRLRANLTGFWLETKALQTPSAFIDPSSGAASFITQNFADYRNRGIELELTAAPITGLNVYANFGYQDDTYKVSDTLAPNQYGVKAVRQQQLDCRAQLAAGRVPLGPTGANNAPDCAAGIVDANGEIATPVRTPEFSLAVGGTYDFPIPAAGIILQPSLNVVYRSSLETGTANGTIYSGSVTAPSGAVFPTNPFGGEVLAGSKTEAYVLINAAFAMRTDDNNWILSLECNNCLDKLYAQSSLVNYTYPNPPRTWLVRAKRTF